jgi:hypothetical protein
VTKRRNDYRGFEVVGGIANQTTATTFTTADVEGEIHIAPSVDPFLCFIAHDSGYAEMMDMDLFKSAKISLVPWAKVEGVLSIAGKPAADVGIQFDRRDPLAFQSAFPAISYLNRTTTDAAGRYRFERCAAGEWVESFDQTLLMVTLAPGQALLQQLGKAGTDLRGRISLPQGASIDWDRSRAILVCWEQRTPPDAATKLPKNSQQVARRRVFQAFNKDGSFQFVNVEPAEYELNVSVHVAGDQSMRPKYSKKMTIARAMFLGKTTSNPIDLGEIPLSAAARR